MAWNLFTNDSLWVDNILQVQFLMQGNGMKRLKKVYLRGFMIVVIGSLLVTLSGMFLTRGQMLVVAFVAYYTTIILHREAHLQNERVSVFTWLITILVCLTSGFLSGVWQLILCSLLRGADFFRGTCGWGYIMATIWVGVSIPSLWILVEILAQLFSGRHKRSISEIR